MKIMLGTKIGMTRIFDERGRNIPVTLIQAGPVTLTHIKTPEKDGYHAVQVGFGVRKAKRLNFAWLREFRMPPGASGDFERGKTINVSVFQPGDIIKVSGISKGKGFAGVVKRHGFHGGPRTHGQKHSEREPGSISTGRISTVRKGKRMAGRMGSERVTVKGLTVVEVDPANNLLAVKGAITGKNGALLKIRG